MLKLLRKRFIIAVAIILAIIVIFIWYREEDQQGTLPGYMEANLTYISTQDVSGRLTELNVKKGQQIVKGQTLFSITPNPYKLQYDVDQFIAQAKQNAYENTLTGKRQPYIDQIKASIVKEEANLAYLKKQYQRASQLLETDDISQKDYDLSVSQYQQSKQQLVVLKAKLEINQLAFRDKEIASALAQWNAAKKTLEKSKWYVDQTVVKSPATGVVFDTFYWPGEQVQAFHPVLAVVVPQQVKLVFYVPETKLYQIKLGQTVGFKIDGVDKEFWGAIDYISPKVEYTPPVVYSQSTQNDLSFKVEASVHFSDGWHLGQPVRVYLRGDGRA